MKKRLFKHLTVRGAILAGLLLSVMNTHMVRAETCPLPRTPLSFDILNEHDNVGALNLAFTRDGDKTRINISMHILVKVLFVEAYKFRHNSTEHWHGPRLEKLTAETSDNGDDFAITVTRTGDDHLVHSHEGEARHRGVRLTELLWCEAAVKSGPVLSTLTGHLDDIPIERLGPEDIEHDGKTVTANRYRFVRKKRTGNVWYDRNGVLLKLTYPTRYYTVASFSRTTE